MISYAFVSSMYTLAWLAIHLPWGIFFTLTGANMPFIFITPLPSVVSSNHSKGIKIILFFEFKSRKNSEHYRNIFYLKKYVLFYFVRAFVLVHTIFFFCLFKHKNLISILHTHFSKYLTSDYLFYTTYH